MFEYRLNLHCSQTSNPDISTENRQILTDFGCFHNLPVRAAALQTTVNFKRYKKQYNQQICYHINKNKSTQFAQIVVNNSDFFIVGACAALLILNQQYIKFFVSGKLAKLRVFLVGQRAFHI